MKRNSFVVIALIFLSVSCRNVPSTYFSDFPRGADIVLEKPESKSRSTKNAKKDVGAERGARGTETASLVLLLTGDLARIPDFISREVRVNTAHATAGAVGQNVYLIANALGLRTRLVGTLNEEGIRGCLKLRKDEIPLYIMPLGYGK